MYFVTYFTDVEMEEYEFHYFESHTASSVRERSTRSTVRRRHVWSYSVMTSAHLPFLREGLEKNLTGSSQWFEENE